MRAKKITKGFLLRAVSIIFVLVNLMPHWQIFAQQAVADATNGEFLKVDYNLNEYRHWLKVSEPSLNIRFRAAR